MKFSCLMLLLLLTSACYAENIIQYRVEGKLSGTVKAKFAYLSVYSNSLQKSQLYQATIVNGSFVFTGTARSADGDYCGASLFVCNKPGYLSKDIVTLMRETKYDFRKIILEKAVSINIGHSVKESVVTGGELNNINTLYQDITVRRSKREDSIRVWYRTQLTKFKNDVYQKQKTEAEYYKGLQEIQKLYDKDFFNLIHEYPSARQSEIVLLGMFRVNKVMKGRHKEELESIWNMMPETYKQSEEGKECMKVFSETKDERRLTAGSMIPGFTFKPDNGQSLSMESFRGKYVLLDFWTSWCGPCRGEHFYMKKAYEKFHSRNFTILQYSFDRSKEKWLKALKEEELPWMHLRDMKGWNKEVADIFDVQAVPTNYLVGPDGKIIAYNLRGEALELKLSELLGNK